MSDTKSNSMQRTKNLAEWLADEASVTHYVYFKLYSNFQSENKGAARKVFSWVAGAFGASGIVAWLQHASSLKIYLPSLFFFFQHYGYVIQVLLIFLICASIAEFIASMTPDNSFKFGSRVLSDQEWSARLLESHALRVEKRRAVFDAARFLFVVATFLSSGVLWCDFFELMAPGAAADLPDDWRNYVYYLTIAFSIFYYFASTGTLSFSKSKGAAFGCRVRRIFVFLTANNKVVCGDN
ncbi:hypothetical protein [Rhodobacter capsulatus]|nr:hypothetical protein [Rhodobacter capsulatus]MDS0928676.1 hypothetical protein [Rhodobacter capsulatus]TQD35819.1 hypothetical protein FKW81_06800 [Rhodobacter capsulatus]